MRLGVDHPNLTFSMITWIWFVYLARNVDSLVACPTPIKLNFRP
jgi:hypothetical protein